MTTREANQYLGAILETAAETEPGFTGETIYQMGLGVSLSDWTILRSLLYAGELATFDGNAVKLTDKGRAMAAKVSAFKAA